MKRGFIGRSLRRQLGVPLDEPERLSEAYASRLERAVAGSRHVRSAVVLALDGVYDARGEIDLARTHFYVPNDAVLALARRHPHLQAGASVNPRRRDALAELERVAEAGAVLIKWLPNAQEIDPASRDHLPFYRALVRLGLPLLVHTGVEFAVKSSAQDVGSPERWRLPLEEGVSMIAAHGGSTGLFVWERHARVVFELLDRYPHLIADSSALLLPNRMGMLGRIRKAGYLGRLTFGTDYPLPCFPGILLAKLEPARWLAVRRVANYFDRQVELFRALGWEPTSAPFAGLLAGRACRPPASPAGTTA
jgi:hypothetical protein